MGVYDDPEHTVTPLLNPRKTMLKLGVDAV